MIRKIRFLVEKNKYIKKLLTPVYAMTVGKHRSYKLNKNFMKNGQKALYAIDDAFKELNIEYWLEFGTLLGAVREKDFIGHDEDIDLGLFSVNYNKDNEKIFNKYGLIKVREILSENGDYAREETYTYNEVEIDLFYFHKREEEMYCHTFAPEKGKSRVQTIEDLGGLKIRELRYPYKGLKYINFFERDFLVPSNIEEHLSASYGKNYMIKDENYSNDIATNVRIITNKIGIRHIYE
jgi:phosphorylcholine metabolism protein LicD